MGRRRQGSADGSVRLPADGSDQGAGCQCCACCGLRAKGWLLLAFALLALFFAVAAVASPWYLVYNESAAATVSNYYQWSGPLQVTQGHNGNPDSTKSLSWNDLHMPQTRTLFTTTLVIIITALVLVMILTCCVVLMILLPAYNVTARFILPRSSIRKRKWKWTFVLTALGCFVVLLLSFTLFLKLPRCFASDQDGCSTNECASFIGMSRQEAGYLNIYTPFVGWCSAVISCVFVLVTGILYLAFFGRKRARKEEGHALAAIGTADECLRRDSVESHVASADEDDDYDSDGERRPLLAGDNRRGGRSSNDKCSQSPASNGVTPGHRPTLLTTRASPKKVEDATSIEECDSPLAYHNPCPTSPSPARILPIADLSSSSGLTPRSLAASLQDHVAEAAEETQDQGKANQALAADTGVQLSVTDLPMQQDNKQGKSETGDEHADMREEVIEQMPSQPEEKSSISTPPAAYSPNPDDNHDKKASEGEAKDGEVEKIEEKETNDASEQNGDVSKGDEEKRLVTGADDQSEEKSSDSKKEELAPKRRFATMQRLSYKDYAKKKPPAPTPESILGPSRVRGVPTNRLAMRAARGAPLSSMRSIVHTPPMPSRSATTPSVRRPYEVSQLRQHDTEAPDSEIAAPSSSHAADPSPETPIATPASSTSDTESATNSNGVTSPVDTIESATDSS